MDTTLFSHKLASIFAERMASGLRRKAATSNPSLWAETYRVMGGSFPGPWKFDHHPWLREMHDCDDEIMVGQKSAQMGYTECALNKSFFSIDINGDSVLYILPTESDASDFSSGRFDPALELSPHLSNLFSDVKNTGHKRAGGASLYVRGSRSKSKLKSVPAGILIFDEVDEMVQENLPLAIERASGQLRRQRFYLSTPTIDNYGISKFFGNSTQDHFIFVCPCCGRKTELVFPECLVITSDDHTDVKIRDSYLICKECKNTLVHERKPEFLSNGLWVPQQRNKLARGFHINQLYSFTMPPYEIAISYLKSLTNPTDEQEFHNSKMGQTHVVKGARISDTNLADCTKNYNMMYEYRDHQTLKTMGIDVGKRLHVIINEWHFKKGAFDRDTTDMYLYAEPKVILATTLDEFEDIDKLLGRIYINFCVIDANPERRKALEFARRYPGKVRLCFYGNGSQKREIVASQDVDEPTITVDRTSWLDIALPRFINQEVQIPLDFPIEAKTHLKAMTRIYEKDKDGNPVGRYVAGEAADHYAHACNYAEIALPLAMNFSVNQNIPEVIR